MKPERRVERLSHVVEGLLFFKNFVVFFSFLFL